MKLIETNKNFYKEDAKLKVLNKDLKVESKEAKDITYDDFIIESINRNILAKKIATNDFYFLLGCFTKADFNAFKLKLKDKEKESLEYIKKILDNNKYQNLLEKRNRNYVLTVYNDYREENNIFTKLLENNQNNAKSYIRKNYLNLISTNAPLDILYNYLQGVLETQSGIRIYNRYLNNNKLSFLEVFIRHNSLEFLQDIRQKLMRFGINPEIIKERGIYRLNIRQTEMFFFSNLSFRGYKRKVYKENFLITERNRQSFYLPKTLNNITFDRLKIIKK